MQETLLCREIIQRLIVAENISKKDLSSIKLEISGRYKLGAPSNSAIIQCLRPEERGRLLPLLKRKSVRSVSGIIAVAVMTAPYPCPKNSPCVYCPGGPDFAVPQSYTGFEPATMRGLQNDFDPYDQTRSRIEQLEAIGHTVDKVELIVMGGTFPATPLNYQEHFVQRCLDAITCVQSRSLVEAKKNAESSAIRNVGITVETRPDRASEEDIDHMLSMGVTRVELGVQTVFDKIYALVNRGHRVEEVIKATRALKDSGMKVCYHMMPGLPGSNFKKDLDAFRRILGDQHFKPDMIKIYPCLVLRGTKVYGWWLEGKYEPYTTEEAVELIAQVKKMIPSWVRVMRIQRDIPAGLIMAGVKNSNLRELVLQKLKDEGSTCRCIRCREIGHRILKGNATPNLERIHFSRLEYEASRGREFFVSIEDRSSDALIGYLRLRVPSEEAHRPEIGDDASVVRELHIYGEVVPVGKHLTEAWQHRGYGALLLSEAEKISLEELGSEKIVVTSALGTKQYYKSLGYDYDGPYVSKHLEN